MDRGSLHFVAAAVLALGLSGCCGNVPDETVTSHHEGIVAADRLMRVKAENDTPEDRCDAGCRAFVEEDERETVDEVLACSAMGNVEPEDPWADANDRVMISCTTERTSPGFCTGRRPLGHQEAATEVVSVGSWLAVHAHLERASVVAFEELAAWLEQRDAPAELVARCRAAALDEVRHADVMTRLARSEGAEIPETACDPARDDAFAVALHNAVEGCVREAFAAIVASYQAQRAAEELRPIFAAIAEDELRHGQLAWDLHDWLVAGLSSVQRAAIARAQAAALDELVATCADNARRTPARLGWPPPTVAAAMAHRFGTLLQTAH